MTWAVKKTLHESGLRPASTSRARMSSRISFISGTELACTMIMSACSAAKRLPRSDAPAWHSTGTPCGERGSVSGPRTE